jgi:hypothetical protein
MAICAVFANIKIFPVIFFEYFPHLIIGYIVHIMMAFVAINSCFLFDLGILRKNFLIKEKEYRRLPSQLLIIFPDVTTYGTIALSAFSMYNGHSSLWTFFKRKFIEAVALMFKIPGV